MPTKKELWGIYKLHIMKDAISTPIEVLTLIIVWYLGYKILFWIMLSMFILFGIKWMIRIYKLENRLGIWNEY